jgi:hypothetical protein
MKRFEEEKKKKHDQDLIKEKIEKKYQLFLTSHLDKNNESSNTDIIKPWLVHEIDKTGALRKMKLDWSGCDVHISFEDRTFTVSGAFKEEKDEDGFDRDGFPDDKHLTRDMKQSDPTSRYNTKGFDMDGYDKDGYDILYEGHKRTGFLEDEY